jgi:hypothetical protein
MISMNRKRAILAIAAILCFLCTTLLGQTAFAMGGKYPSGAALSAPTTLKITGKTDTSATISWKAPKNHGTIAGYNVYRGSALVGTAAGTSFVDNTLTPNTLYMWTVKSYDASGRQSAASKPVSAATPLIIRDTVEWAAGSVPGPLLAGLIVEDGAHLGIGAGVVVKLNPGQSIVVYGSVNAAGSQGNPVVVTSAKDKAYGGCGVKSARDYWCTIDVKAGGMFTGDYMKIVYGSTLATVRGTMALTNSEAANATKTGIFVDTAGEFNGIGDMIHNCCANSSTCKGIDTKGVVNLSSSTIYDCPGTGVLVEASGTFNGTSVDIRNCGKGVEIQGSLNFVLSGVRSCKYGLYFNTSAFNGVILNSFMGNDQYGVYNARPNAVMIDASMNYWGSPLGPSVFDPVLKTWSAAGDRVSAGVLYDNWLTEEAQ